LQAFGLVRNSYEELSITGRGINRLCLRWYDQEQNWILTPAEKEKQLVEQEKVRAEQEKQRAEQEKQRADSAELQLVKLRQLLVARGIDITDFD
jgi:hypothetical protein